MKTLPFLALLLTLAPATGASTMGFQCRTESGDIRNVDIRGDVMTVVNPKTPRIVFSKTSDVETRGDITRYENDAWQLTVKDGIGHLKNLVFEDVYACIQFRGAP
jgi:hypothetical protein